MAVCFVPLTLAQQGELHIDLDNAWVRAMPPTQSSTAGYLSVYNGGDRAVEVVAVNSLPRATVEMHNSIEVDGMMTMKRLLNQKVEPGETVEFTPGGKHLMIMGLEQMPAPGDSVELCLEFNTGNVVCTQADVLRTAPGAHDDDQSKHQHH